MEAKKLSNQSLTIRLAVKLPPCVEGNAFEPDTSVSTSSDTPVGRNVTARRKFSRWKSLVARCFSRPD